MMLKEAARVLCPGGLLLLGEWAKTPTLTQSGTQIPRAFLLCSAFLECLHRVKGITDFLAEIPRILRRLDAFSDIRVEGTFVPIGDWCPSLGELGDRCRDGLKIWLDSIRPLLRQGGYRDVDIDSLVRGYRDEMDNVKGLGLPFYTISAFRR